MIGYELYASGIHGKSPCLVYRRSGWTEGSLALLKLLVSVPKVSVPGIKKGQKALVGGVEKGFAKLKDAFFIQACSLDWDLRLAVCGDLHFIHNFRASASIDLTAREFGQVIASQKVKMRDQVVTALCSVICAYRLDVVAEGYNGPYALLANFNL